MNSQGIAQFIPLILIFVIFYFFLIRPQQKRVKEHKVMTQTLKRGDEVITPANSYVASTGSIVHLGAKPVFVDVLPDQNIDPKEIQKKITKKTKAIMPVHLTGRPCQMDEIIKIQKK